MIPSFELNSRFRSVQSEVRASIDDVLDSTWFVLGKQVRALEEEFAT